MRRSVSVALILAPFAAPAANLPRFDIQASCRSARQIEDTSPELTVETCVHDERLARDELKRQSEALSEEEVQKCVASVSKGAPGSYLALLGCVDESGDPTAARDRSAPRATSEQATAALSPEVSSALNYSPDPSPSAVAAKPPEGAPATKAFRFRHDLKLHANEPDVKALQIFLNAHGFPVAVDGAGSSGNEVEIFGPSTKAALQKFQNAHAKDLGNSDATGRLDAATRKFINGF